MAPATSALPQIPWATRRVTVGVAVLVFAGFLATFVGDAGAPAWWMLRDALSNLVAIAVSAVAVVALCRWMEWSRASRWWFLPVHAIAAIAFAQLWYVVFAVVSVLPVTLAGAPFVPNWLQGPARRWQLFTAVFIYLAVAAACYLAQAARDWQRAVALQHEAESAAMRAQLDPHVLFNTLHSLLELVRSGDARADDAIDRFARLARYVSEGRAAGRDLVPLADEWRAVEDYLALESLRLGPRLTHGLALDPGVATAMVPALTLQPLVENAIVHGIAPRAGAGTLAVSAARDGEALAITVVDDGLGAAARTAGSGRGLALVRRRLAVRHGDAARFEAGPRTDGAGWRVALRLPLAAGDA
jgi:signal transduction histidine kinase